MADEITLTLPRAPEFHRVAHLGLSGLAVRLNLTIENLEDLQLALDAVLARMDPKNGDVTVQVSLRDGEVAARIGALTAGLRDEIGGATERAELGVPRVPPYG